MAATNRRVNMKALALAGYQIILLGEQRHIGVNCEQLAQGRCPTIQLPGIEPTTYRSQLQRPNHYTTKPPVLQVS